jgi:hypothetical protein
MNHQRYAVALKGQNNRTVQFILPLQGDFVRDTHKPSPLGWAKIYWPFGLKSGIIFAAIGGLHSFALYTLNFTLLDTPPGTCIIDPCKWEMSVDVLISRRITMSCSTEWKKKGVCWALTGIVTGREMHLVNRNISQDRRFHRISYQVLDFTGADSFDITEKDVKDQAFQDLLAARSNPDIKLAIVAPQDLMHKLGEIYAEYAEPSTWESRIFDTLKDANQWLKSLKLV